MPNLTIRVSQEELDEAKEACRVLDSTISQVVRGALRGAVERARQEVKRREVFGGRAW